MTQKSSDWYIADIVLEITVENEPINTVHINTFLVRANSSEDAYRKSIELGEQEVDEYKNNEGNTVKFKFRGIKSLIKIYEELEHGAELFFEEEVGVPEDKIKKLIRRKEQLDVFSTEREKAKLNYMPKEIYEKLISNGVKKEELE